MPLYSPKCTFCAFLAFSVCIWFIKYILRKKCRYDITYKVKEDTEMEKNSGISLTVNEDDFNEIKNMVSLMRQC